VQQVHDIPQFAGCAIIAVRRMLMKISEERMKPYEEKAWKYVGRFIASFADIEAVIDEIFLEMFNLNEISSAFLLPHLDFHKKVALIRLGLKRQKIDFSKLYTEINELKDIRNVIVHSQFTHARSYKGYKAGIDFSYTNKDGSVPILNIERRNKHERKRKKQKRTKQRQTDLDDWYIDRQTIPYSQFDKYFSQAKKLAFDLVGIKFERINDGIPFIRDVSHLIASSTNVVPFPSIKG
jgi:hypothetical protein